MYAVGLDLGGTFIKGAVLHSSGKILCQQEIPTGSDAGAAAVIERLAALAEALRKQAQLNKEQVLGVGIGTPGNLNVDKGIVIFSPNLFWRNLDLVGPLTARLQLPVMMENDANTATLGEAWVGAGASADNLVMLTLGTGIGSGIILDGKLYRGVSGSAGEIGHTIVVKDGLLCNCGQRGCLETLTAAPWLEKAMGGEYSAKEIYQRAQAGDAQAAGVVERAAEYLGIALANLVNLLNPRFIILGGGVSKAGEFLRAKVEKYTKQYALEVPGQAVTIRLAQLGNAAGFIGAARLVFVQKGLTNLR